MESSIAAFLMRWSACELLPTKTRTTCILDVKRATYTSAQLPHGLRVRDVAQFQGVRVGAQPENFLLSLPAQSVLQQLAKICAVELLLDCGVRRH